MKLLIILRLETSTALVFIGIMILIAVLAIYFSKKAVIRRAIRNTPHKPIREFQEGDMGKIIGKIVFAGQTLLAPLTGRPCAAYQVEIQEWKRSGKRHRWVTVITEEKKGDIIINDGTQHAWIEHEGLHFYLMQDGNFSSGAGNDAAPHLEAYLSAHGRNSTNFFGWNRSIRYREGILEENELLAVVGCGNWGSARQKKLNLPVDRILTVSGDESTKIYLTDDPEVLKQAP